jgi:hypothetical protein
MADWANEMIYVNVDLEDAEYSISKVIQQYDDWFFDVKDVPQKTREEYKKLKEIYASILEVKKSLELEVRRANKELNDWADMADANSY